MDYVQSCIKDTNATSNDECPHSRLRNIGASTYSPFGFDDPRVLKWTKCLDCDEILYVKLVR